MLEVYDIMGMRELLPVENLPLYSVCVPWECGCVIVRLRGV